MIKSSCGHKNVWTDTRGNIPHSINNYEDYLISKIDTKRREARKKKSGPVPIKVRAGIQVGVA